MNQALLAARAGATYVSPFLGRLDDISEDGVLLVAKIAELFRIHNLLSKHPLTDQGMEKFAVDWGKAPRN